jgi:bifunctional non-homologous end joining protein LigD
MSKRHYGSITFETSNEDKVFFPEDDITKGDVMDYYHKIARYMLPHIRYRPLMMHRFPDGISGKDFYHKEVPDYFPDWVDTLRVSKEGGAVNHVVCNKQATLVYLADQACITPHAWLSRSDRIHYPDRLIFDLDPPGDDFGPVRSAAGKIRCLLDELNLDSFPMTTGSRGLHVVVPLNRKDDFDTVRQFAQQAADLVAEKHADELTVEPRKNKRGNRLYVDTNRNGYAQTGVAPYSIRARRGAPVATPLDWRELANPELTAQTYTMTNIFRRLGNMDDPWQGLNRRGRSLDGARRKLERMGAASD